MSTSQDKKESTVDPEEIILREILTQLHYPTQRCNNCKWIDHRDGLGWHKCKRCLENYCEECECKCDTN